MNKNIICSSGSSSNEFLLESGIAENVDERLLREEAMDSDPNVNVNGSVSNITATESALRQTLEFNSLQESNFDNVECIDKLYEEEPSSVITAVQMQASSHNHFRESILANSSAASNPSSFPFPPAHKSSDNILLEMRKTSVCESVISPVHKKEDCTILSGDNTTVSKITEQISKGNYDFPQRDEEMLNACDKTISRKSSNGLYYYENEEIYHIDEDTSFERSHSYFNSPNQLNSISFDEDALIHEFELQSLEDRMSVSECFGSEYEYISDRSTQLVSSLTNNDICTVEEIESFNFSEIEPCSPYFRSCKASLNVNSFSEELLCKEAILYSDSSDFPETPSTIKADLSMPENLKCGGDWLAVDSDKNNRKESVVLKDRESEDQLNRISHAFSDPALTHSDATDSEPLRKVKSAEKQHKLQFPTAQDLTPPYTVPEEVQTVGSSHSDSEKTPSSEHNVLTNGMTYVELETSSGGFLHMETDISSSQLTYTEADVSSKALKISDQDFSSSSLPYTEADVSSIEFPCTEQDIESSVIYTDADTNSNGLPYNEPDDTSSGWPQVDVDTNSTSKLHKEIDTSSYGISSNEFDASSSVFDSSSSGLPYIECESTNRLSYRTLQSCSSGRDVDSLVSASSSGFDAEEKSAPEPLPQPPVSTNEAPCKDQLKCFPF